MANYYVYLMSSLPSLVFGAKPPFSFGELLRRCDDLIPRKDIDIIKSVSLIPLTHVGVKNGTLSKWVSFEIMLRNELVKIRALRKKTDAAQYMREDGNPQSVYTAHLAINAYKKASLVDAEKALDLDRWQYLDEISAGHYFDVDILIVYACKLLILEKWDLIASADTHKILEEALA